MPRPPLDEYFLGLLPQVASRGTCRRRQVAAIIINVKGHILATGYNGVPSGIQHCTDVPCPGVDDPKGDSSRCEALHAEASALLQCLDPFRAHTIYCSCTPCFNCAKMICNTSIKRVITLELYPDPLGLDLFERAHIYVEYGHGTGRVFRSQQ